ncbi:clathrin heavy chain linker domain-containing protein 1 isoform X2 [Cynoglossus semilaevis]|uniref:clathrin heavy chain linker domain-containing protein 1 isoform X2 n=1 Tax=Cynoglossus semilaevis TaxID=244447 RepID=UPI000D629092|nr:clathrin heavy chain linker domain-containing protein 1 isoform X2 [Cynoglossus semilaevis]
MRRSQIYGSPCSKKERSEFRPTGNFDQDQIFLQSLKEYMKEEKVFLNCPPDGADELRYTVYRSVFSQVISRATLYRKLLLNIKSEYDDVIEELKRKKNDARTTMRHLAVATSKLTSLKVCQCREEKLRHRIADLKKETSQLRDEIKRRRTSTGEREWIPGLTVAQSQDVDVLDQHLNHLCAHRDALLEKKRHCVPLQVKVRLDAELQRVERRRGGLKTENQSLKVLYKRLAFVYDGLCQQHRLEEVLDRVRQIRVTGDDSFDTELFRDEEPSGLDESELLDQTLDRFVELFDSAQFEEAALLAASSPGGVLRNLDIMEMFEGVIAPPDSAPSGSSPPLLHFFQALLTTAPAGVQLSAPLSLRCVLVCAQHRASQLVVHAVSQNKLTFSEELGDVLTEHALKNASIKEQYLALASVVYEGCGPDRKSALSMCRRGLNHRAAELMEQSQSVTDEDMVWVLCQWPSLSLLRSLTEPRPGDCDHLRRASILSVCVACSTLLTDPERQPLVLQLLDDLVHRGVLEDVMLEDNHSTVDGWIQVVSLCSELKRVDLSQAITSVLLSHGGTRVLSPGLDGARLVEHVFL